MASNNYFRLNAGRHVADIAFDHTFIPTSAEKDALAGEGTPSGTNKYTTKEYMQTYVKGLEWQQSVDYSIDYVKSTAGAPSGVGAAGELCLNTNEAKLYTYAAAWDAGVACVADNRYIFKDTGVDVTGNSGTFTPDDKIRTYVSGTTFIEYVPVKGSAVYVDDESVQYCYNGVDWIIIAATVAHNTTTGKQGGAAGEYYHLIQTDYNAVVNAAGTPDTANPFLTLANRTYTMSPISFVWRGGIPINQTDVEMYDVAGAFQQVLMAKAFSIVAITVQSSADRTAGSIVFEPTINGTKLVPAGLDITFDAGLANNGYAVVAAGTAGYVGVATDKIGVKVTTDGTWAPVTSDIEVILYVVFDT